MQTFIQLRTKPSPQPGLVGVTATSSNPSVKKNFMDFKLNKQNNILSSGKTLFFNARIFILSSALQTVYNPVINVYIQMIKLLFCVGLLMGVWGKVVPFDKTVVDYVFKELNPCVFLLTGNTTSEEIKTAFYDASSGVDQLMFSHSDVDDGTQLYRKLADFLGLNHKESPQLLYYGEQKKKYKFEGQYTKDNIINFIKKAQGNQIDIFVKSSPVNKTEQGPVLDLEGRTFPTMVLSSEKEFFIKLYAHWCPHSRGMRKDYEELAKRLANNPNLIIAQMDYEKNEIYGIQITGYPTLLFWKKNKLTEPIQYQGEREADQMMDFLKEVSEYEWITPLEAPEDEDSIEAKQEELKQIDKVQETIEEAIERLQEKMKLEKAQREEKEQQQKVQNPEQAQL